MDLTSNPALTVVTAGALTLAAAALFYAALHDVAFRTVPNWIPLVLLPTGCLLRAASGTLTHGLIAGLLVFFGGLLCWRRGWLGGGDVKLLGATTVLVPPMLAANMLVDVALSGGILALLYLGLSRVVARPPRIARPDGLLRRVCRTERYRISRRGPLPYASAIAGGALFILLKG